jgi:hypothetical protein
MTWLVRVRASVVRVFAMIAGVAFIALYPEIGECVCAIPDTTPIAIPIDATPPTDINVNGSPNSPCATLQQAGAFAWHEFIALNWPAATTVNNAPARDTPDTSRRFGDASFTGPLVWHTFRGKVEIFPVDNSAGYKIGPPDYGYDQPPSYNYGGSGVKINLPPGADKAGYPTPWINLDENSQIGLNKIYAGVVSSQPHDTNAQILFMAKANRKEYAYVTGNQWWSPPQALFTRTAAFVQQNQRDPQPGSNNCDGQSAQGNPPFGNCVSLPDGAIEVKAGWRKLTAAEAKSGRFYTTRVRHYVDPSNNVGSINAIDEPMGLVGLHIIQKTPTAPYFIYATFEQADNITTADGSPIEDENGDYKVLTHATPMTPDVISQNAGPSQRQTFTKSGDYPQNPGKQLYYQNIVGSGLLDGGIILVNKRINDIPPEIVGINKLAHNAIATYAQNNHLATKPVWMYYKLVNVQYVPITSKVAGIDDAPRASYYQSNSVIETDYNLQKFSGDFVNFPGKQFNITDFSNGADALNVSYFNADHTGVSVNMGGCMGCHGNSQAAGGSFSFILFDAPVKAPEWDSKPLTDKDFARFATYLRRP